MQRPQSGGEIEMGGAGRLLMADFEYESLLDRARDKIPTEISERARWTLPDPEILIEGNQTIIRNLSNFGHQSITAVIV